MTSKRNIKGTRTYENIREQLIRGDTKCIDNRDYQNTVTLNFDISDTNTCTKMHGHYNPITHQCYINDKKLLGHYETLMPYIHEVDIQTYILNQSLAVRQFFKQQCDQTTSLYDLITLKYSFLS